MRGVAGDVKSWVMAHHGGQARDGGRQCGSLENQEIDNSREVSRAGKTLAR
jgi:hypothetical protein